MSGIIGGIKGSMKKKIAPGGAPSGTPGLKGKRYVGYHGDVPSWYDTATEYGETNTLTSINRFSSSADYSSVNYYSWQWVGYFYAPTTGSYTFYTASDDGSYLWIGASATSGYSTSNCLVNNGGGHGVVEVSGTISLTAGTYYPIRVQFGEMSGGDEITVSFTPPGGSKTTNGTNYYFV
jgi:hypothetical protein